MKLSMLYAMRVIVLRNSELISSVVTNNKTKKNRNANVFGIKQQQQEGYRAVGTIFQLVERIIIKVSCSTKDSYSFVYFATERNGLKNENRRISHKTATINPIEYWINKILFSIFLQTTLPLLHPCLRGYSSVHTQQPAKPEREIELDPYILLDDDIKYVTQDIRDVSNMSSLMFGQIHRKCDGKDKHQKWMSLMDGVVNTQT